MLKVFFIDVYALLHPGANLSFVTPLVAKKLSTVVRESIVAKRVIVL